MGPKMILGSPNRISLERWYAPQGSGTVSLPKVRLVRPKALIDALWVVDGITRSQRLQTEPLSNKDSG